MNLLLHRGFLHKAYSKVIFPLNWLFLVVMLIGLAAAEAGDFEFVVIGDTRPRVESEDFHIFRGLIDKVNEAKPAFAINLGDLIYGYGMRKKTQWDKYEQVTKAFQMPYYQLPGNHDTFSASARREYGRRFGKFYYSFNYGGCHFVTLDTCEKIRWGYIGNTQWEWLKADLATNTCKPVFVFTHFPVWEQERIKPAYFDFWKQNLHPLFREAGVAAVFGGHYHCYGPTLEMDGIRYFITGGGGAELLPDYRKSGGEHHFMKVKVTGGRMDLRVVTSKGELTDAEADIMGGYRFADRHSSRIGITQDPQTLREGVSFSVMVDNPYKEWLSGKATWRLDSSAFAASPQTTDILVPPQGSIRPNFAVKALTNTVVLQSLPRLDFHVASGAVQHRFHRELLFLKTLPAAGMDSAPVLDGSLREWTQAKALRLGASELASADVRALQDWQHLYLAISVPAAREIQQEEEEASADDLLIGMAVRLNQTDFAGDKLRLGLSLEGRNTVIRDRTPGHSAGAVVRDFKAAGRLEDGRICFEIAIPRSVITRVRGAMEDRLILSLSFPSAAPPTELPAPDARGADRNSFSYQVRFGGDALVPIYFVEIKLDPLPKRN
jgi:hypothetical protein